MTYLLQTLNLEKTYNSGETDVQVLKNLDFAIFPNEFVSVQGESGSGKTTFLHTISLLLKPTGGQIFWEGQNFTNSCTKEIINKRKSFFGFVFQNHVLVQELTAYENLLLARKIAISTLKKEDFRKIDELFDSIGLSHRKNHLPNQLSGGEKQRIAVARALVNSPKLIIADEPTGSLDEETGQKIIDLLFSLAHSFHASLILVTHNQSFANQTHRKFFIKLGNLKPE